MKPNDSRRPFQSHEKILARQYSLAKEPRGEKGGTRLRTIPIEPGLFLGPPLLLEHWLFLAIPGTLAIPSYSWDTGYSWGTGHSRDTGYSCDTGYSWDTGYS